MDDINGGGSFNGAADLADLAETTFSYLLRLSRGVTALADRARLTLFAGVGGCAEMEEIVAGLQWSMSAMKILTAQNGCNPAKSSAGDCEADCAHIVASLKKALEAVANGDCVFFADMLEFEVNPVIVRWQTWIMPS